MTYLNEIFGLIKLMNIKRLQDCSAVVFFHLFCFILVRFPPVACTLCTSTHGYPTQCRTLVRSWFKNMQCYLVCGPLNSLCILYSGAIDDICADICHFVDSLI